MQAWETPIYTATMAGRLVKLKPQRVRNWLKGYQFYYETKNGTHLSRKEPVMGGKYSEGPVYASFLDLIGLLFIRQFLEQGVTLQKLRRALEEADALLGDHPFAKRHFYSSDSRVYFDIKGEENEANELLELVSGRQYAFAEIIAPFSKQIVFDASTDLAMRWFPHGENGLIVIDPCIAFGRPVIVGSGIATATIYDLFLAEDSNLDRVADWMEIERREVEAAVNFEAELYGHEILLRQ